MSANTLPDLGFSPSYGLTDTPELAVDTVSFGDGYEQTAPSGINSVRGVWDVSWKNVTKDEAHTVYDFLLQMKGVYSFQWIVPDTDAVVRVKCANPKLVYNSFDSYTVSGTFREVFE